MSTTFDMEVGDIFPWVLVKVIGPHMCVGGVMTAFAHRGFGVSAVRNYIRFLFFFHFLFTYIIKHSVGKSNNIPHES